MQRIMDFLDLTTCNASNYNNTQYQSSSQKTIHNIELNNYILNECIQRINVKKSKLKDEQRYFIERKIAQKKHHSILIYNSKEIAKNFNHKVTVTTGKNSKSYACRHFALAIAKGVKPAEFDSIEKIKNHHAINFSDYDDVFNNKIPQTAYYFDISQFTDILNSISTAVFNCETDVTQRYILNSQIHTMSLIFCKKNDILAIKFYDPNVTNIQTKALLLHPNDTTHLRLKDFLSFINIKTYFFHPLAMLYSIETVDKTSKAKIYISLPIDQTVLGYILSHGHYTSGIVKNNSVLVNPTVFIPCVALLTQLPSYARRISLIPYMIFPETYNIFPCMYNTCQGFLSACMKDHQESIIAYMTDVVNSNNSINKKLVALAMRKLIKHSAYPMFSIGYSFISDMSDLWLDFIEIVLASQQITNKEKIQLIQEIYYKKAANMLLDTATTNVYCKGGKLVSFKKYIDCIINTKVLNKAEKSELINANSTEDSVYTSMVW